MRIGVWNCCNGLSHPDQVRQFHALELDVTIIPECRERDIPNLAPDAAIWRTNNHMLAHPKGLAVLTYNGFTLEPLSHDPEMEIYIPLRVSSRRQSFNLLAVWNFYHAAKQGRFRGAKGETAVELTAIRHYAPLMNDHFIMAGDFNYGPTFSGRAFVDFCKRLSEQHVYSAYHAWHGKPVDQSDHATFRHSSGKTHHLDHIFLSADFKQHMSKMMIPPISEVVRSDHAPIFVEIADMQPS